MVIPSRASKGCVHARVVFGDRMHIGAGAYAHALHGRMVPNCAWLLEEAEY